MNRDYIARDPRTGKPLLTRRKKAVSVNLAFSAGEGAWDAIPIDSVIPLAIGDVKAIEVIWKDKPKLLSRPDGVRALPRIRGNRSEAAYAALDSALIDIDPRLRTAGLNSLPFCALQQTEKLFDHLHELLDDIDGGVRNAAAKCLVVVAPVFPSATEDTLRRELRLGDIRRDTAFEALTAVAGTWPEVAELHIDELIREDDEDLRARAAKILPRLAKHHSATLWDLIGWCLQDENVEVRRHASRSLAPLADRAPKVAQIALEIALFDEDTRVRNSALRAFKKLDPHSFQMRGIINDGTKHRDRGVRIACIKMIPVILTESETREMASSLLRRETDDEIVKLLTGMSKDDALEGTEAQKNKFLAPAEKVIPEEGSLSIPPPGAFDAVKSLAEGGELEKTEGEKTTPPANKPDPNRRPTQDEIFYGDEDEDEDEDEDDDFLY